MRVNHDGEQFKVVFKHGCTFGGKKFTRCIIECDEKHVSEGLACCSSRDQFSKERGRKLSLARALNEAFSHKDSAKDIRKAFWEEYLKRKECVTTGQHKERHSKLHEALDELAADWSNSTGGLLSDLNVLDLLQWSNTQTKNPDHQKTVAKHS